MEIGLIWFKEIGSGISLNHRPDSWRAKHALFQKGKSRSQFSPLQASLISILQKFSYEIDL
jgi:hypothetical protein